jgi:hypothetical protein
MRSLDVSQLDDALAPTTQRHAALRKIIKYQIMYSVPHLDAKL